MPKRDVPDAERAKVVPYSAPPPYHLFLSLVSKEWFGRPNVSLGLRQVIRELAQDPHYAQIFAEATRLAAEGGTVPDPVSKGKSIYALQEIHIFLLLYPWREVQELNGSLGLQMTIIRLVQHEPYASAWAQIQASNTVPTVALPTITLDEASGGRAVDYSCSEEMHTFLNWLGENNRPLGVRRAVSALAQLDSSVRGYLTEAEDLAPQTRAVMDAILNDEAVATAFYERTDLEIRAATKHNERVLIEWALFNREELAELARTW